jgi:hypothetical protein
MTAEMLRRFQRTQPFVPFAVHLADGRTFEIRHPDVASLSDDRRTVTVLNADDLHEVLSLLLIVSLRPLRATTPKQKKQR